MFNFIPDSLTKPTLDPSTMARTKEDVIARRRGRVSDPTSSSDLLSSSEEDSRRKEVKRGRRNAPESEGGSPSSQVKARVNKIKARRGGGREEEV